MAALKLSDLQRGLLLGALGGAAVALGLDYAGRGWFEAIPMAPTFDAAHAADAYAFCSKTAVAAQHRSTQWLGFGLVLIALGVILSSVGVLIGPGAGNGPGALERIEQNRNVLVTLLGALFVASGWMVVQRADAATNLAAGATLALTETTGREAYVACVVNRAAWVNDRLDHTALHALASLELKNTPKPDRTPPASSQTPPAPAPAPAFDGGALSKHP